MQADVEADLAKVAATLKLGAGPEFGDRRDGLRGLKEVYGLEFGEFRQFAALRLRYEALAQKQIDVANGFSTDWQIAAEKFVARYPQVEGAQVSASEVPYEGLDRSPAFVPAGPHRANACVEIVIFP